MEKSEATVSREVKGHLQAHTNSLVKTDEICSVNSQSKCNSSKEAAISVKNSSINFKKKAKNNKKGS